MVDTERQVVVVTGASAGVGRATAVAFGRQGAAVALLARGRAGLEAAAEAVDRAGGTALTVPTDVSDPVAVTAAAEHAETGLGPIDVWVNNAMVTVLAALPDLEPDEFRRVTEVTYLGSVFGTMAALRHMRPRDRGVIVQVGSALAFRGIPLQSAYCGAKHALRGFVESVRTELRHEGSGVRLVSVEMPALNTPQFNHCRTRLAAHPQPVPPIYQPEVAADAILYAAAHDRRDVFVGDATVATIWGNRLAPGLMERYLARTGVDGQQAPGRPFDPQRPDNLFNPTDDQQDEGAHGVFDDRARSWSPQLAATKRRRGLLAAGVGAATALAAAAVRKKGAP